MYFHAANTALQRYQYARLGLIGKSCADIALLLLIPRVILYYDSPTPSNQDKSDQIYAGYLDMAQCYLTQI